MSLAPLVSEFYSDAASEEFVDRVLVGGSLAAHKHLSLHYRDHKIIRGVFESGRTLELYNVKRDRREKINLAGFEREILAQYSLMLDEQTTNQEKLAVVVAEKMGSSGQKAVFTNFMEENLKALGYVE
jgi:hypothetical protein